LARYPKEFLKAGDITHLSSVSQNPEFAMTNKGLKIETMLERSTGSIFMPLNCTITGDPTLKQYGIYLVEHSGRMIRDWPELLASVGSSSTTAWSRESIYIAKDVRIIKGADVGGEYSRLGRLGRR
jgi:hypothetical protein